jgi:hypothetical protein
MGHAYAILVTNCVWRPFFVQGPQTLGPPTAGIPATQCYFIVSICS